MEIPATSLVLDLNKIIHSQPKPSITFVLSMAFEPQNSFIQIDYVSFELRKLAIKFTNEFIWDFVYLITK